MIKRKLENIILAKTGSYFYRNCLSFTRVPAGNRTLDPMIKCHLLYQLSDGDKNRREGKRF